MSPTSIIICFKFTVIVLELLILLYDIYKMINANTW